MTLVGIGLFAFLLSALFSKRAAAGYAFAAAGAACTLAAGVRGLLGLVDTDATFLLGSQPMGLGIDHLSAIFLTLSSIVWFFVALFGLRYGARFRRVATVGFNLALMGMTIVVTAVDAITFLVGWELMTIFVFLMLFERSPSERPPFGFLAFGELSTIALVIGFAALYGQRHSITLGAAGGGGTAFFVFASLGMIIKMDIVPFHAWMRSVYEHLPGHIAAIASVSVTLMGVYGLERTVGMSDYAQWWALALLALGAISAFWGALMAASTRGLRSLPAYSTVESNGMILAAVGLSAIAASGAGPGLSYLAEFALAAALVLAVGHALAKSLFFLSLGRAMEVLRTRTIGETRSVWIGVGKIPALGIIISGLSFAAFPPLVGYVGEWMLLQTTFQAYKFPAFAERFVTAFAGVLVALALGLMAFSMVKFIGYTVLGREKKGGPSEACRLALARGAPDRSHAAGGLRRRRPASRAELLRLPRSLRRTLGRSQGSPPRLRRPDLRRPLSHDVRGRDPRSRRDPGRRMVGRKAPRAAGRPLERRDRDRSLGSLHRPGLFPDSPGDSQELLPDARGRGGEGLSPHRDPGPPRPPLRHPLGSLRPGRRGPEPSRDERPDLRLRIVCRHHVRDRDSAGGHEDGLSAFAAIRAILISSPARGFRRRPRAGPVGGQRRSTGRLSSPSVGHRHPPLCDVCRSCNGVHPRRLPFGGGNLASAGLAIPAGSRVPQEAPAIDSVSHLRSPPKL